MPIFSLIDKLIMHTDTVLQTLLPPENRATTRETPGAQAKMNPLPYKDKKHIAGLMRVNHSGEVAAQALYQGQSLTARLDNIKDKMNQAALEEVDHLAWCEERLKELNAAPSLLNPFWYALSFSIGALAGAIGDKWSLGFVAETERQVTAHLNAHLNQIPKEDNKTRAILKQMIIDETAHATSAEEAGGHTLPEPIKLSMTYIAKLMTNSSYYV
jgi:ubiquinone biosynthesis monooxygenase Coq7